MSIEEWKEKAILSVNSCISFLSLGHFDTKARREMDCGQLTEGKRITYNAGINRVFEGSGLQDGEYH